MGLIVLFTLLAAALWAILRFEMVSVEVVRGNRDRHIKRLLMEGRI